jgi:hypothetical protein
MRIAGVPQGAGSTGAFVMLFSSRARLTVLALPLAALAVGAQSVSPSVDWPMVARIREEGLQRSRVMETVADIADVLGARLMLSNDMKRAQAWVKSEMERLGVGSTDHISSDRVGLPGFQCLQDRVGGTGGHTNLDLVDTLPAEDLTKNATIVASFAYHAAMADTKVPRKPLRPQGGAR